MLSSCSLLNFCRLLLIEAQKFLKTICECYLHWRTPNSHLLFDREYTNINIKWKIYENNIIRMCLISTHVGLLLV